MGGCYTSSSGGGYSSAPAVPKWQTTLKDALKTGDREKLTDAYKGFFTSNRNGFIAEAARVIGIRSVEQIPKEFPEIEYEVKFDIAFEGNGKEPALATYLDAFDFPVARSARFLKDPVNSIAEGTNRFYGTDTDERLVVITKGGGAYLK